MRSLSKKFLIFTLAVIALVMLAIVPTFAATTGM